MVNACPLVNLPCRLFALVAPLFLTAAIQAEDAPAFPADPNAWINSGPLSVSGLKGKGIVLWFFEEESPNVRDRWAEMLKEAAKFDGQPVVFIAVNSGNQRAPIEAYIRELKVPWPVIVDPTRDFEKACQLIKEIDAANVSQIRYITPSGEILAGLTDEISDAAEKAVEGAEWKVDPKSIPDTLKSTWSAVEIGNYKGLSGSLKKFMASTKPDIKEAAGKLMAVVQQEMTDQMATIKEAQEGGNAYKAFELANGMTDRFAGLELPKELATLKKDLTKDPKVKAGVAAAKNLEAARKQLATGNPGAKNKAVATLEKIIQEFPETTLALHAKAILDYSDSGK